MRRKVAYVCLLIFFCVLYLSVSSLNLGERETATYYLEEGTTETGSPNIVNSIVWDFRSYDTLGEESVLFVAALGVFLIAEEASSRKGE